MSPPQDEQPTSPRRTVLSRRNFIASTAVAAAVGAVGFDLTAKPQSAAAAVTWAYPFTFRTGRSRGFSTGTHYGVDYLPGNGTPVYAVADGYIQTNANVGAYGQHVILSHSDGFYSIYGHMQAGSNLAAGSGAYVPRGTFLGRVGSTGNSTGPHLHMELRRGSLSYPGACINPDPYIDNAPLAGGSNPGNPQPQPTLEDNMIRISSPNRGTALIGPGYIRSLSTQEEIENSGVLASASFSGNDRQFDLGVSMATQGTAT